MVPGPDGKCGSFLNLLQPERYSGPLQESTSKPDLLTSAASGPPITENVNQRAHTQAGMLVLKYPFLYNGCINFDIEHRLFVDSSNEISGHMFYGLR